MPRFTPRKGMPSPRLNEVEFRRRFLAQFQDPAFDSLSRELDQIAPRTSFQERERYATAFIGIGRRSPGGQAPGG